VNKCDTKNADPFRTGTCELRLMSFGNAVTLGYRNGYHETVNTIDHMLERHCSEYEEPVCAKPESAYLFKSGGNADIKDTADAGFRFSVFRECFSLTWRLRQKAKFAIRDSAIFCNPQMRR
jgi:hypothetical protein